jgi:hypothetical protein
MPLPGSAPLRRALLGLTGALAIAAAAAPIAHADFTLPACGGAGVAGRGSTFQGAAFNGFRTIFNNADPVGCSASATVRFVGYNVSGATGSGAGLAAMGAQRSGNTNGDRDQTVRFAGTDIPPSPAQRQQIETGSVDPTTRQDVTAADNDPLHVIPIAMGAITILIHLPDNCDYSGAQLVNDRPTTTNVKIEKAFAGELDTWGDLFTGLSAGCASQPLNRIVRHDESGTTFALKQFLQRVNPGRTPAWGTYDNTAWPQGLRAAIPADTDGGGGERDKINATTGIGYLALSDARGGGGIFTWQNASDTRFWIPIQHQAQAATFDDPQLAATGYKLNDLNRGANCVNATPNNPLPASSLGDWSGVDYTYTSVASTYGICTLTYDLAFDDNAVVYCNNATEEASARTLKDFLQRAVLSQAGQATLPPNDYDKLPTDALLKAADAATAIGWNKGGKGRPCTGTPGGGGSGGGGGGGGGGTGPGPKTITNAFTIASSRVSGTSIRLSLQLPGAGQVKIAWSTKPKKGKKITLAAKSVTVTKAGAQAISLSLSPKAKKALKKDKKLKVTLKITYTPTGGTAKTTTKTVTVKQPKKG